MVDWLSRNQIREIQTGFCGQKFRGNRADGIWSAFLNFWNGFDGIRYDVTGPNFSDRDITTAKNIGMMPIYIPDRLTGNDLMRVYPQTPKSVTDKENTMLHQVERIRGWLWIEDCVESPRCNTNQEELRELLKRGGSRGLSLPGYIVGSAINDILRATPFDGGRVCTFSRLLGTTYKGLPLVARHQADGKLWLGLDSVPSAKSPYLGGRAEKVIGYHQ